MLGKHQKRANLLKHEDWNTEFDQIDDSLDPQKLEEVRRAEREIGELVAVLAEAVGGGLEGGLEEGLSFKKKETTTKKEAIQFQLRKNEEMKFGKDAKEGDGDKSTATGDSTIFGDTTVSSSSFEQTNFKQIKSVNKRLNRTKFLERFQNVFPEIDKALGDLESFERHPKLPLIDVPENTSKSTEPELVLCAKKGKQRDIDKKKDVRGSAVAWLIFDGANKRIGEGRNLRGKRSNVKEKNGPQKGNVIDKGRDSDGLCQVKHLTDVLRLRNALRDAVVVRTVKK